jgi:phosphatidylglycerol:prolipoprotein diacylglycerol transferase
MNLRFNGYEMGIFGLMTFGISMGQWLSVPMVIAGILMMLWSKCNAQKIPTP